MANNFYEFKTISDLEKKDKNGSSFMFKKGIITKNVISINDVLSVSEVYNDKGNIVKGECKIYHKDIGGICINHRYEDIKNLIKQNGTVAIIKGYNNGRNDKRRSY